MSWHDPSLRRGALAEHAPSSVAAPAAGLPAVRETTRHLPRAEQFAFWRDCNSTLAEYDPPPVPDAPGFLAEACTWRFGSFALMTATTPAARFRRLPAQIRRDGIDHWVIAVATHGERVMRAGDAVRVLRPGTACVISFDQVTESQRTDSGWIMLFVPRDAFPTIGGTIDAMRLQPLDTPMGMVLHDYLVTLAGRMPEMRAADAAGLASGTHALLAAALAPSAERMGEAAGQVRQVLVARMRTIIRENLHLATLGPERLCRVLGMSRSQLYRACEPFGGVATLIQAERLRAAERALCDPGDRRTVAQIATDVGIFNPSTFGRLIRRRIGCTPGELREAALSGRAVPTRRAAPGGTPAATLRDLLTSLGA